jgi:hypothetical protein
MTSLPLGMGHHNGDEATVSVMVGTMASSFIEENKALVTQERIHLHKTDFSGGVAHLVQKFQTATHRMPSSCFPKSSNRVFKIGYRRHSWKSKCHHSAS